MIRWAWDEIIASDAAIQPGQAAGVRPSWRAERARVGASRRSVCHTFLFAGCGYVLRLIVTHEGSRRPFFGHIGLAGSIRDTVKAKGTGIDRELSCAILGAAAVLVPETLEDLKRIAETHRCPGCTCVLATHGPLNSESPQGRYLAEQIAGSEIAKRNAA